MSNPTSPVCPRCGASLVAGCVDGLCANCLGALNFVTETRLPEAGRVAPAAPVSVDELTPHFPQLEILECLGRGGMGVVYKARQKSLGRTVALKLLAPERAGDAAFAVRFAREAQALAALNHPGIVGVYDFGEAGGFFYLLMEYVDGVNLRQAMQAGRFTPEQALAVVPPVCEALQFAHDHGIVHRDIKPENLLLDKTGRVKIADFGIAKMLGDEATAGLAESQPAGTPQYMAPEQKEHRRTDHRADIYSLGVVLYEMLTGELPAAHLQAPSRKVLLDVRLDEIVLRALEKAPERRYQTATEMGTHAGMVASSPARATVRSETGGLFLSRLALLFLAVAFILPPLIFALGGRSWMATAAGAFVAIACLLMTLGFALFSREQRTSRAVVIGVSVVLVMLVILGGFGALVVASRKNSVEAPVQSAAAEMAGPQSQVKAEGLSFGPVHEQAIKDAFDLDTGRAAEIPNEQAKTHDPAEPVLQALDWMQREGMDVEAHGFDAFLPTFGMKVVAQPNDAWDKLSATEVAAQLAAPQVKPLLQGKVATEDKVTTCLFQTREGGRGILQFLEAQDDDSVRFRYKLVSPGGSQPASVLAIKAWQGDIPNYVEALGDVPLTNVSAEQPKPVFFDVPEKYTPAIVKKLQAGTLLSVEVNGQDGAPLAAGELVSVADHINETSGTLRCTARVTPKPDTLLYPGQFALVRLLLETRRGVTLIPARAIQRKPKGSMVYVLSPAGMVAAREVTAGVTDRGVVEVTKGLEPGEIVVTEPGSSLPEGSTVVYQLTPDSGK